MEHMDLDQTTIMDKEHKKLKLHNDDTEDDTTSYPSKKWVKHDLDLPEEKHVVADHGWFHMFDFECYTLVNAQVYKDMVIECEKEIKACQKVYTDASHFFDIKFGDLEKILPCNESSIVISYFREVQQMAKESLDKAYETLPTFTEHVVNYVEFRNGPLSCLKLAEDRYFKKTEELAEIPNIGKMIKELLYNVKDDIKIEHRSGLTRGDICFIIDFLRRNKNIFIPDRIENVMNEEQYGESEMEDLLIQYEASMKELSSIRNDYETAKTSVKKHVEKHELKVIYCVVKVEGALESADYRVRIMRRQLELLLQKDVISKGYDEDFEDEWLDVYHGR